MAARSTAPVIRNLRPDEILSEQVRLLYANADISLGVTVLAATVLAALQWSVIPAPVIVAWWIYTTVVALSRYALAARFRLNAPPYAGVTRWRTAFVLGAGLAGIGWGAAGFLLYPHPHPVNQVFLAFVLGGMMLGAASLLASRPEAFLAFIVPAGLCPTIHLLVQGDTPHLAMGVLAAVFTLATLTMTWHINQTLDWSLRLRCENQDLLKDLLESKNQTQALNEALEVRVKERTAELEKSAEQLRTEIAQREHVEEELLRARKLESLGVLAGGIAHDFNNFLTIVQGNVQLAKTQLDAHDPLQENLDTIAGSCRRAAFLSSQLLTFAKGGAPVRRVVSVARLVKDAVQLARVGDPISIAVHIAEDLPTAEVDPNQIVQVLHNILLNAREAMPQGGIIEVRAYTAPPAGRDEPPIRISIRDYGCGIPAAALPRIFDPYFTTKAGASGLGLATAYAIVAKHGGHITVESKPGDGALFTISIPACRESASPTEAEPVATHGTAGSGRLLVMDDEEAVRQLLRTVLTRFGYQVTIARDGAEAIDLYERANAAGESFDAVLLDLTVSGGMGGIETAAKLKELDPMSRLIVSSGYASAPVMSDFARYGFEAVIPKPWNVHELGELFRRILVADRDRKTS